MKIIVLTNRQVRCVYCGAFNNGTGFCTNPQCALNRD